MGRCVVASRRHIGTLSDLSREEWADFGELAKCLESAIKVSFEAVMFNWAALMNHSYREESPDPHVHWHMRPRYNRSVDFDSEIFTDPEFGHMYDEKRSRAVSPETHRKIIERIKLHIPAVATQTF